MYYYCTIKNIETQISTATLIQLTSDENQSDIDRVVAEEAIIYASTVIDGYLRGRYSLPLNTRFPLLRVIAMDLAIYRLYSRRMRNEMPEVIAENYKNAVNHLKDIQKGILTLETEPESNLNSSNFDYKTNKTDSDRIFNKCKLNEY